MDYFFTKISSHKKSGESLIEVLIAIVILVIFLTSILTIINQAVYLNVNIKNRVQALGLAREGIEGVRNIRDTNWLRFSGDRRSNWLCAGVDEDNSDECETNLQNRLDEDPSFFVLTFEDGHYGLQAKNKSDISDQAYRLYQTEDGAFTTDDSGNNPPTIFYRQIELSLAGISCPEVSCPEKLQVVSRVGWAEENGDKEIILETHLFDYYKRTTYE